MKIYRFTFLLALAAIFSITIAASAHSGPERKIIVFEPGLSEAVKDDLVEKAGGVFVKNIAHDLQVAFLTPAAEKLLQNNPQIVRIDPDIIISINHHRPWHDGSSPTPPPAETIPWGIDRIDAPESWVLTRGAGINVASVDTGIDLDHPDLASRITKQYNAINPDRSADDDNGHGTHTAGTIAAIDNEIGVIGVGPEINLFAVKVLNRRGSGWLSDIIEGIDWAVANGANVINMSLGTNSDIQSFHDAVKRAYDAGVTTVAAAGNDGAAVDFPAAYPEVIAVGATNSSNQLASWSSRGPELDLTAPGVKIYSTYKGGGYKTLDGTSMSSPHVAGSAALLLSLPTSCDTDLNGVCSPAEVEARLEATATDLGTIGFDTLFGWGLVNIFAALTL